MLYLYCSPYSEGAAALSRLLEARFPGGFMKVSAPPFLLVGDRGVSWGRGWGSPNVLNPTRPSTKLVELQLLTAAGVPTVPHSTHPRPGWLGRSFHHYGGRDLMSGSATDYWVKKLEVRTEYRIHVFRAECIAAAMKVPKPNAHPWIRNHDNGWAFEYQYQQDMPGGLVALATRATSAVGLDFSAVDLGVLGDGSPVVFETNTAPGLGAPSTALAYANAITSWFLGD